MNSHTRFHPKNDSLNHEKYAYRIPIIPWNYRLVKLPVNSMYCNHPPSGSCSLRFGTRPRGPCLQLPWSQFCRGLVWWNAQEMAGDGASWSQFSWKVLHFPGEFIPFSHVNHSKMAGCWDWTNFLESRHFFRLSPMGFLSASSPSTSWQKHGMDSHESVGVWRPLDTVTSK